MIHDAVCTEHLSMKRELVGLAAEPDLMIGMVMAEDLRLAAALSSSVTDARLLASAVADPDPLVSIGSVHALAAMSTVSADGVLVDALHDPRPWIREHAAWALSARRPQLGAVAGLLDLHGVGSDLTAMVAQRTLAGWAGEGSTRVAAQVRDRVRVTDDEVVRRRLVDTLALVDPSGSQGELVRIALDRDEPIDVRAAAVGALAGRRDPDVHDALLTLANEASPIATLALLALFDTERRLDGADGTDGSGRLERLERTGVRIGQLTMTGELDGRASRAGAGDNGGVANLLVSVSHALAARDDVASVISIGRSSPDEELASLLVPDVHTEVFAAVGFGSLGRTPALTSEWDHRVAVERGIRRVLVRRTRLDVLHLRMADVGTLAAASVARRLGVRTVFTCAADPHVPISQRQFDGSITRENFGMVDAEEHLWFRARMVERLAGQADHLVLFPRHDAVDTIVRLLGLDRESLERRTVIVAEGIDLANLDRAAQTSSPAPIAEEVVRRLPADRLGRALVVSVGRFHPIKGMARVVRDWLADDQLTESTNLVIVGGDLHDPSPVERQVIDEITALVDHHPAGSGVVLVGAREPEVTAQILHVAVRGDGERIASDGVYVNGAPKEEFGLAVLEALAVGLPVVAPAVGGPSTYVEHGVTGVLVNPADDLAPAIRRAATLHCVPGRAEAARSMIEERYTVDAYAQSVVAAYTASLTAPVGAG